MQGSARGARLLEKMRDFLFRIRNRGRAMGRFLSPDKKSRRATPKRRFLTQSTLLYARPLSEAKSAAARSPPPSSCSNPASANTDTRGETCDAAERVAATAVVREGMRAREAARGARGERGATATL